MSKPNDSKDQEPKIQLDDTDLRVISTMAFAVDKPIGEIQPVVNGVLQKFGVYLTDQQTNLFLNDVRRQMKGGVEKTIAHYQDLQQQQDAQAVDCAWHESRYR